MPLVCHGYYRCIPACVNTLRRQFIPNANFVNCTYRTHRKERPGAQDAATSTSARCQHYCCSRDRDTATGWVAETKAPEHEYLTTRLLWHTSSPDHRVTKPVQPTLKQVPRPEDDKSRGAPFQDDEGLPTTLITPVPYTTSPHFDEMVGSAHRLPHYSLIPRNSQAVGSKVSTEVVGVK